MPGKGVDISPELHDSSIEVTCPDFICFDCWLQKCQKRKDVMRLRLLMSYLQNGIEKPWQRISSITAVFVAEASFVLLDPSHDHYSAISAYLMRSPSANMKVYLQYRKFLSAVCHKDQLSSHI